MMMQIVPMNWFSWDFKVSDESRPMADIALSSWRDKGELVIGGATHWVYREVPLFGDFILESLGGVLARAEETSVFRRAFVIRHAGREYTLRPGSMFRSGFVLLDGSREVGSIVPKGIFTRKAAVDLPPDLALPLRLFIVWLTVMSWRQDAAAAGGC
jgi:hypothetical protein